jgi:hypothetical protein
MEALLSQQIGPQSPAGTGARGPQGSQGLPGSDDGAGDKTRRSPRNARRRQPGPHWAARLPRRRWKSRRPGSGWLSGQHLHHARQAQQTADESCRNRARRPTRRCLGCHCGPHRNAWFSPSKRSRITRCGHQSRSGAATLNGPSPHGCLTCQAVKCSRPL